MPDSLKEVFWSADSIAEQWISEDCVKEIWPELDSKKITEEELAQKITRTFREICERYMEGTKEPLQWYQSKSANGIRGKYLFGDGAPELMKELFLLSRTTKKGLLEEEKEEMYKCLAGLLPLFRSMDEVKILKRVLAKDKIEWERKCHSLLNIKPESLEPGFMAKIMKANVIKEAMTESSNIECYKQCIRELLDSYYTEQAMGEVFSYRIFVEADKRIGGSNKEFYQYQYALIKEWAEKWCIIMENASAVRIAERFEGVYEEFTKNKIEPSERKKFYKEGKASINIEQNCKLEMDDCLSEEELYECLLKIYKENNPQLCQKKSILENAAEAVYTEETCRKACEDMVYKISDHEMKKVSIDDFNYLGNQAVRELEEIHKKTEKRRHEIHYRLETDRTAGDIEILYCVRSKSKEIEKGRTIIELAGLD